MAEIKSTMDIIMEKTKNLSLTEEEKEANNRKEAQKKVKGLLTRYWDRMMDLDALISNLNKLGNINKKELKEIALQEGLAALDPETDNHLSLAFLEQATDMDMAKVQALIAEFQSDLKKAKDNWSTGQLHRIHDKGVSGSAVLPNPNGDPEWKAFAQKSKARFQKRLQAFTPTA